MFCFQGFTEFSGLRSSSASLPFGKKLSSDEFVSIVSFQTSAVSSLFSSNIICSLRVLPYDDHQLYEMFVPICMSIDKSDELCLLLFLAGFVNYLDGCSVCVSDGKQWWIQERCD